MFRLRVAEHCFNVDNRYAYVEQLCRDYIVPISDRCDAIRIMATDDDLEKEKLPDEEHSELYLESIALYRKMTEHLISDDIFLCHCSAIAIDGNAVLFAAPSGTGKSTHAELWKIVFGDRVQIINDDKPLIKILSHNEKTEALAYGTPWSGKHDRNTNIFAKIAAVVLLEQGVENIVTVPTDYDAFPRLLNQIYRPKEKSLMTKTLSMAIRFSKAVPFFQLQCDISEDAVRVMYHALKERALI